MAERLNQPAASQWAISAYYSVAVVSDLLCKSLYRISKQTCVMCFSL